VSAAQEPPDPDDLSARKPGLPYDLVLICLAAICMAILIGVSAGVVWLRVFRPG
jgi:hypothetical protein